MVDCRAFGYVIKAENGSSESRFSATGFSDNSKSLSSLKGKGNSVYRTKICGRLTEEAFSDGEILLKTVYLKYKVTSVITYRRIGVFI